MYEKLKNQYEFSDYQIAQLTFLFKTLLSEFSKFIIIGFFFIDKLPEYFVAIAYLAVLRVSTGGLHCHKYLSCLCMSFLYMVVCVRILPLCYVSKLLQMICIFVCILLTYYVGPVTSNVHMPLSEHSVRRVKIQAFVIIFFFLIITYILPENPLITVCFWVTMLNTVQLLIAKIRKKGAKL